MKFSKMITMYRNDRGISLRKLAKILGMDFRTLYQIEAGHSPTARNLVKLMVWAFSDE